MKQEKTGGSMPTVFNAANELAVSLIFKEKDPVSYDYGYDPGIYGAS